MKEILELLYGGNALSTAQASEVLLGITRQKYSASQVAAFLSVYRMREVSVDELAGFREAMLQQALPLDLAGREAVDLCGTGGDGKNTFNISTIAAFVVAGAGVTVVKHGNYGLSSTCGSSNLLEALEVPFPTAQAQVYAMLDRAGIAFLHAPLWHPAMKSVAQVRKDLGVRTLFNILGPLVNPARPAHQLVGVFSRELFKLYGALLQRCAASYAVVFSLDGYDEFSLTGEALLSTPRGERVLHADALGLSRVKTEDLRNGESVSAAAKICLDVLHGRGTQAQAEVVLANAALAIALAHPGEELRACVDLARESLRSGRALKTLSALQEMTI